MRAVFPSTALRADQASVKRAAENEPVIITDNNSQHYIFCSESAFDRIVQSEAEQAAYAARMARAIRRARSGIARGEYVVGADAAIAAARHMGTHE